MPTYFVALREQDADAEGFFVTARDADLAVLDTKREQFKDANAEDVLIDWVVMIAPHHLIVADPDNWYGDDGPTKGGA